LRLGTHGIGLFDASAGPRPGRITHSPAKVRLTRKNSRVSWPSAASRSSRCAARAKDRATPYT
jgi:hypothetical protein